MHSGALTLNSTLRSLASIQMLPPGISTGPLNLRLSDQGHILWGNREGIHLPICWLIHSFIPTCMHS